MLQLTWTERYMHNTNIKLNGRHREVGKKRKEIAYQIYGQITVEEKETSDLPPAPPGRTPGRHRGRNLALPATSNRSGLLAAAAAGPAAKGGLGVFLRGAGVMLQRLGRRRLVRRSASAGAASSCRGGGAVCLSGDVELGSGNRAVGAGAWWIWCPQIRRRE